MGSWEDFTKVLYGIYGQKDSKASAKEEFTSLWANKSLAARDFIKYSEQFKTLASIVEYKDDVLIDKLREVIPSALATAVGIIESVSTMPTKWDEYLDKLLVLYKNTNRTNTGARIFGKDKDSSTGNDKSAKEKSKEVNTMTTTKATKFCQICSGLGKKGASKTHNTADCYSKPENANKRPQTQASSSGSGTSASHSASADNNKGKGKPQQRKSFKARLLEVLDSLNDDEDSGDDDGNSSTNEVKTRTARIEGIVEEEEVESPAVKTARASKKKGSSSKTESGFPKGM